MIEKEKLPPRVIAIMVATSTLTFGTLALGYRLLF
jgi:hypothetical protein